MARRRRVMTLAAMAGAFLLPASFVVAFNSAVFMAPVTAAIIFNHEGNTGAQVAEAASRVTGQREERWRRPSPTATSNSPRRPAPAMTSPKAEDTVVHGIKAATAGDGNPPQPVGENADRARAYPDRSVPPTVPFNRKARAIRGDRMLTRRREAMDRIVENGTPRSEPTPSSGRSAPGKGHSRPASRTTRCFAA